MQGSQAWFSMCTGRRQTHLSILSISSLLKHRSHSRPPSEHQLFTVGSIKSIRCRARLILGCSRS